MHKGSLFTSMAAVILGVGAASAMLIPSQNAPPHQAKPKAGQAKVQPQHDGASSGFALLGGAVAGGGVGFDDLKGQDGPRHSRQATSSTRPFMAADGLKINPPAPVPPT